MTTRIPTHGTMYHFHMLRYRHWIKELRGATTYTYTLRCIEFVEQHLAQAVAQASKHP